MGGGTQFRTTVKKALHSVYSVLLFVLIYQTVAFHSSFLLFFTPQAAESLLTLMLSILVTAALHSSRECSSSSLLSLLPFHTWCVHSSHYCSLLLTLLFLTSLTAALPLHAAFFTSLSNTLHSSNRCSSLNTLLLFTFQTAAFTPLSNTLHSSNFWFSLNTLLLFSFQTAAFTPLSDTLHSSNGCSYSTHCCSSLHTLPVFTFFTGYIYSTTDCTVCIIYVT